MFNGILHVLCRRELAIHLQRDLRKAPFVISVILHGSRATGEVGREDNRDYDIFVVLKTPLLPLYVKRLKGIEAEAKNAASNLTYQFCLPSD